jgi:hypothetical protein
MTIADLCSRAPWLGCALACALAVGCAPPEVASGDFPAEPYATIASDEGAFVIEVRTAPRQPPTRGSAEVELRITDADGEPIDDLSLDVVPFMPDMGHAAATEPSIEALGGGRYDVSPVDMFMSGRWELLTTIDGPVHDSAKVAFEIE